MRRNRWTYPPEHFQGQAAGTPLDELNAQHVAPGSRAGTGTTTPEHTNGRKLMHRESGVDPDVEAVLASSHFVPAPTTGCQLQRHKALDGSVTGRCRYDRFTGNKLERCIALCELACDQHLAVGVLHADAIKKAHLDVGDAPTRDLNRTQGRLWWRPVRKAIPRCAGTIPSPYQARVKLTVDTWCHAVGMQRRIECIPGIAQVQYCKLQLRTALEQLRKGRVACRALARPGADGVIDGLCLRVLRRDRAAVKHGHVAQAQQICLDQLEHRPGNYRISVRPPPASPASASRRLRPGSCGRQKGRSDDEVPVPSSIRYSFRVRGLSPPLRTGRHRPGCWH